MNSAIDIASVLYVVFGSLFGAFFLATCVALIASFVVFLRLIKRGKKRNETLDPKISFQVMGNDFEEWTDFMEIHTVEYDELDKKEVSVKTFDGLTLVGDFVASDTESTRTIICVHGYKSAPKPEFSAMIPFLRKAGFNLLLVNNRAHGPSQGKYIGFGMLDSKDILKWIDAVNELVPNGEIYLYGISMGAAAVMHTCGLDNLPNNVKGAIEDCGFTSPWDVLSFQCTRLLRIKPFPLVHMIDSYCKTYAKYSLKTPTAPDSVSTSSVPILFIHGDSDVFVPTYMAEINYKSCTSPKNKLIVEGAGHAMSYFKNPELYEETVLSFIEKCSDQSDDTSFDDIVSSDYFSSEDDDVYTGY